MLLFQHYDGKRFLVRITGQRVIEWTCAAQFVKGTDGAADQLYLPHPDLPANGAIVIDADTFDGEILCSGAAGVEYTVELEIRF